MAEMNFEGLADLDRYFERIGEDVEKAEDVALQAAGKLSRSTSDKMLIEAIKISPI